MIGQVMHLGVMRVPEPVAQRVDSDDNGRIVVNEDAFPEHRNFEYQRTRINRAENIQRSTEMASESYGQI